ncbi:MAG: hypothetical protein QE271_10530 [Bacteriovoracaceae bacterium]|nr:hypothetical protein [Bacteriovoracaceae bacterium]
MKKIWTFIAFFSFVSLLQAQSILNINDSCFRQNIDEIQAKADLYSNEILDKLGAKENCKTFRRANFSLADRRYICDQKSILKKVVIKFSSNYCNLDNFKVTAFKVKKRN